MTTTPRRIALALGLVAGLALPAGALADQPERVGDAAQRPAATAGEEGHRGGPPVARIAEALGLPVEQVRAAFDANRPERGAGRPTAEQREAHLAAVASALGVTPAALEAAMPQRDGAGEQARPQRAKGPSAAALAERLGRPVAEVRAALREARRAAREVEGRDQRKAAFEAALATGLGVSGEALQTALQAIRSEQMAAQVDRLAARGDLTAEQADAIRALLAAGDPDGAHEALHAARGR